MDFDIDDLEQKLNEVIGEPGATNTLPPKTSKSFKSKAYLTYKEIKKDISSLRKKLATQGKEF